LDLITRSLVFGILDNENVEIVLKIRKRFLSLVESVVFPLGASLDVRVFF